MGLALTATNLRAAIRALILLAVGFGLHWSGEQVTLVMLAVESILGLFRFGGAMTSRMVSKG